MRKLAPPMVTLLSGPIEVQYVTLRNISIIVQKRPKVLENQYRVFFCKYNDPIYCKMEKLDVLFKLSNDRNIDELLNEFKEYATEVDVAFVRRAVNVIGKCAIKLEHSAQKCIDVIVELIKTEVSYVVQECIVVIRDIYRRYPNRYEDILALICQSLGNAELESDAKASMVWIVGEYADRIDNADEVLDQLRENLVDETVEVQMNLLLATVKLFLKSPTGGPKQLVQEMLTFATKQSTHPDLRMRGYVYWRLLSADPAVAKQVVLCERPEIDSAVGGMEPALLDTLMANLASLSAVYHQPPEAFVTRLQDLEEEHGGGVDEEEEEEEEEGDEDEYDGPASGQIDAGPADLMAEPAGADADDDLLGDLMGPPIPQPAAGGGGGGDMGLEDLMGLGGPVGGAANVYYVACQTTNNLWVLVEMPISGGVATCKVRLQNKVLAPFIESSLKAILLDGDAGGAGGVDALF